MDRRTLIRVLRLGYSLTILLLFAIAGCRSLSSPPTPSVLRIGVLPDQSEEDLRRCDEPLVRYLAKASGFETELVIPDDYDDLVERFARGELQLAWFGGVTFLRAERRGDALPLVMRDIDLEFTSSFLVANGASARSLRDLEGGTIAFGPRMSTSGHLMPRVHLRSLGIVPEEHFREVRHTRGHDETIYSVQAGKVDVGAVNSSILEAMMRDGRISAEEIRVLDLTPSYRNYVWAVPRSLDPKIRIRLMDAFLALDPTDPEHEKILGLQEARGYVPVSHSDYEELRSVATIVDLEQES